MMIMIYVEISSAITKCVLRGGGRCIAVGGRCIAIGGSVYSQGGGGFFGV